MSATITVDGHLLLELPGIIWDGQNSPVTGLPAGGHFYVMPEDAATHLKVLSIVTHYGRKNEPSCRVITSEGVEALISLRETHVKDAMTVFFDVKEWIRKPDTDNR